MSLKPEAAQSADFLLGQEYNCFIKHALRKRRGIMGWSILQGKESGLKTRVKAKKRTLTILRYCVVFVAPLFIRPDFAAAQDNCARGRNPGGTEGMSCPSGSLLEPPTNYPALTPSVPPSKKFGFICDTRTESCTGIAQFPVYPGTDCHCSGSVGKIR